MDRIASSRVWAPFIKSQFDGGKSKDGALFMGSAAEVADKIAYMKEIFGITRFIGHMDVGGPNNDMMMKSIELFGEKIAPKVR